MAASRGNRQRRASMTLQLPSLVQTSLNKEARLLQRNLADLEKKTRHRVRCIMQDQQVATIKLRSLEVRLQASQKKFHSLIYQDEIEDVPVSTDRRDSMSIFERKASGTDFYILTPILRAQTSYSVEGRRESRRGSQKMQERRESMRRRDSWIMEQRRGSVRAVEEGDVVRESGEGGESEESRWNGERRGSKRRESQQLRSGERRGSRRESGARRDSSSRRESSSRRVSWERRASEPKERQSEPAEERRGSKNIAERRGSAISEGNKTRVNKVSSAREWNGNG